MKDLDERELIKRTVHDYYPVLIEYTTTDFFKSLDKVIKELHHWGINYRKTGVAHMLRSAKVVAGMFAIVVVKNCPC